PYRKICVLGCGTCVTVCLSGGEKEARETAAALRLYRKNAGEEAEIGVKTIQRQCEFEFIDEVRDDLSEYEAILSLACGVGVQVMAERLPGMVVLPGLNTKFMGYPVEQGVWLENCLGCGNCVLAETQGICPITRCTKSMLNGPCGGSSNGKCEISQDVDCGWHLIYERLKKANRLESMAEIKPPKDWSTSHHGGPRKIIREDVRLDGDRRPEKNS
ncbi:MAG TPA: hypothetical protein GX697_04205, partial [Firmicutes bacterium]|nr:hypothetical protein [Bacillota bacterium]